MDKSQLRKDIKSRLAAMTPQARAEKSKAIARFVLDSDPFKTASVVMAFLPLPEEVDTTAMILAAWQQGKSVVVPKILPQQRHIIPVEIHSLEHGLELDRMGIRNPISGTPVPYADIDLVITPGLGFDRQGKRLGRGGAYYDKFFAVSGLRAAKWAVCFSEQLCPAIPVDAHDIPVDAVVTEHEVIQCSKKV